MPQNWNLRSITLNEVNYEKSTKSRSPLVRRKLWEVVSQILKSTPQR